MSDIAKQIEEAVASEVDERKTCEEMFQLVQPYRDVAALGNKEYENIRADYNACVKLHEDIDARIASLKSEMEVTEKEMNSAIGNISQELFTKHYKVVRDLHEASGLEANIILRRASSAVVFFDLICKKEGLLN